MSPGLFHRPDGETWEGNGEEGCQSQQPTHEVARCLSVLATALLAGRLLNLNKKEKKAIKKAGQEPECLPGFSDLCPRMF